MPPLRAFPIIHLVVAAPLAAQAPDSTLLPSVVVTATRVSAPVGQGLSSTTVLRGDDLRRAGVRDIADALRLVPGVAVARSGGPGAQTSLFLRGGESDYVRVLVDGVPLNDPGGAIDLASLTLDDVDRIEIVRGPVSVLYGTDAMTGVVQIFTRSGAGRPVADAGARVGRYGERAWDASLGAAGTRAGGSVTVSHSGSRGVLALNNGYHSDDVAARMALAPLTATHATVTGRVIEDQFHYPTDASGNVVDRNAYRSDRRGTLAAEAEQRIGAGILLVALVSSLDGRGRTSDAPDSPADTSGFYSYRSETSLHRAIADTRLELALVPAAVLTVGGEWTRESQRSIDSSNFDAARNHFTADRSNRAAYAQLLAEEGPVSLSLGGRYDDNRVFGTLRTGRAALAIHPWHGVTVHVGLGTAFKAPTFYETFSTAFSVGNPALQPERSRGWEVGAEQVAAGGAISMRATWFDQTFRDLIQYTYRQADVPNYFNIAVASARGLEVEGRARLAAGLQAGGSATALDTRVGDAGFDSDPGATFVRGQRLLRRPALTGTLTLATNSWSRASIDAALLYVGQRDDRDFTVVPAAPVVLRAYSRLDVGVGFRLRNEVNRGYAVALQGRITNLLGVGYQEIYNFPAPGRSLSVGVRLTQRR